MQRTKSRFNRFAVAAICCAVGFASCTKSEPPQAPAEVPPKPAPPATTATVKSVVLHLVALDMNGAPLANLEPIATKHANAFDKPVAKGELTGVDGEGTLSVPADQWLFVRAWDPGKHLFANNFYEVLPGEAEPTEVMRIVMLPAASVKIELLGADGAPLTDQFIGMMMSHPTKGPWWPTESKTDSNGFAIFDSLPPGKYAITLESRAGLHVDLPETTLMPGERATAGPFVLR